MQEQTDFGLIGLAVMGENLVLNIESRGFTVAVYNRTVEKVDQFVQGRAKGKKIIGAHTIAELVASLKTPRKIMLMVRSSKSIINALKIKSAYINRITISKRMSMI